MRIIFSSIILLCALPLVVAAQANDLIIPTEVASFVESGTKAIALEAADLNGDGQKDFILALEKANPEKDKDDFPVNQRPLLILLRDAGGKLMVAKRNERIILCSSCGGVFGDPFAGIEAGRNTFTIHHYGGSNWRWKYTFQFNYSRIDKTWQLVRVTTLSYHTSNPNKATIKRYRPPKDFGKVDFADFDAQKFLEEKEK